MNLDLDSWSGWISDNNDAVYVHVSPASGEIKRNINVIIAHPLGPESSHCYKTQKALAAHLAQVGFQVFRFHFAGYGNSTGETLNQLSTATWQKNIQHVLQFASRAFPENKNCVIGLRSGCLLTGAALQNVESDFAIFWYPYTNGAALVRDLQLIDHNLKLNTPDWGIEAGGYPLSNADLEACKTLNLLKSHFKINDSSLVIENGETRTNSRFRDHLCSFGSNCEQLDLHGLKGMIRQAELSTIPQSNVTAIQDWLISKSHDSSSNGHSHISHANTHSTEDYAIRLKRAGLQNVIDLQNRQEMTLRCPSSTQPHRPIYAILSLPKTKTTLAECKQTLLLGNAGASPHTGPNRLHVDLAQQLADQNVASVRYDLKNLGESATLECDPHPYPPTATEDILNLCAYFSNGGASHLALGGLCSGAFHAFHVALRSVQTKEDTDYTFTNIHLINPLFFYWKEGDSIFGTEVTQHAADKQYYSNQITSWRNWLTLLLSPKKWPTIFKFIWKIALKLLKKTLSPITRLFIKPTRSQLSQDIASILDSDIKIHLYFGSSEPGAEIWRSQTDKGIKQSTKVSIHYFTECDHTFSRKSQREELALMISQKAT